MSINRSYDGITQIESVLVMIDSMGIDLEELIAARDASLAMGLTLRSFFDDVVDKTLTAGVRQARTTVFRQLLDGLPGLCSCMCDECLKHFRGDSIYKPCKCVIDGHCDCAAASIEAGGTGAHSCLERCPVLGDVALARIDLAALMIQARWAQMRAVKRQTVRNKGRGKAGLATKNYDGRHTIEHLKGAATTVFKLAIDSKVPGDRNNPAEGLRTLPRNPITSRAYTGDQVGELWSAIFTSGSDDAELDMLIVWFQLETGARRKAVWELQTSDLLIHLHAIRLGEKQNKVIEQPASPELIEVLMSHALRRGNVVASTVGGLDPADVTPADVIAGRATLRTDRPVFYYRRWRKVTVVVDATPSRNKRRQPVLDDAGNQMYEPHPVSANGSKPSGSGCVPSFRGWNRLAAAATTCARRRPRSSNAPAATPSRRHGCATAPSTRPAPTSPPAPKKPATATPT